MNNAENGVFNENFSASVSKPVAVGFQFRPGGKYYIKCRDKNGVLKWTEEITNLITNEGINYALDVALSGGTQITSWFLGLMSATPTPAAGDTLASHAGWTEFTNYTGNRQPFVDGGVASQTLGNTASPASFPITVDDSIVGGSFLCAAATGTSAILYSAGPFISGNKTADNGDTLIVTADFSGASL